MADLLELRGITKQFGGNQALHIDRFSVHAGEIHAVMGAAGVGKSTLARILSGDLLADGGQMLLAGSEVRLRSPAQAQRAGIQLVRSEARLVETLSVAENVFMGRLPRAGSGHLPVVSKKALHAACTSLLEELGYPLDCARRVSSLGAGEKKMVEVLKAFGREARLLVLDEVAELLTPAEMEPLLELILCNKRRGVGVVFISNDISTVLRIADRLTVMRDGQVAGYFEHPQAQSDEVLALLRTQSLLGRYPKLQSQPQNTVLELQGVCTGFLQDVSLRICEGEIVGLYGPVASGRTALAKAIMGLTPILSGSLHVRGCGVHIRSLRDARRHGLCMLSEECISGLVEQLSVAENISLANLRSVTRRCVLDKALENKIGREFISSMGIEAGERQKVRELDAGDKQKTMLAKTLFSYPRVVILDEPCTGLDPAAKVEVYNLINEMVLKGMGVLLITSDIAELMGMCDRAYLLRGGKITAEYVRRDFAVDKILAV